MIPVDSGITLTPGNIQDQIFAYVPEIKKIAQIETLMPFNIDSSNITIHRWKILGKLILEQEKNFDGFVIIHGTDTMAYTASALSFMLLYFPKPVVLTGSQRPLAYIRTDARNNLINAVELAAAGIPEVCIYFGNMLFRGNRTTKVSTWRYDAFDSPNFSPLAEVGFDINLKISVTMPDRKVEPFFNFDPSVSVLKVFPGCINDYIYTLLDSEVRGILIEGYGSGTFPAESETLIPFIKEAVKKNKLVAINTQSIHGGITLELYESGKKALEAGALSCHDMTTETSIVKMMYLFGKYKHELEKIKIYYTKNLAGELSVSKNIYSEIEE